jgi:hypothetical protein
VLTLKNSAAIKHKNNVILFICIYFPFTQYFKNDDDSFPLNPADFTSSPETFTFFRCGHYGSVELTTG